MHRANGSAANLCGQLTKLWEIVTNVRRRPRPPLRANRRAAPTTPPLIHKIVARSLHATGGAATRQRAPHVDVPSRSHRPQTPKPDPVRLFPSVCFSATEARGRSKENGVLSQRSRRARSAVTEEKPATTQAPRTRRLLGDLCGAKSRATSGGSERGNTRWERFDAGKSWRSVEACCPTRLQVCRSLCYPTGGRRWPCRRCGRGAM